MLTGNFFLYFYTKFFGCGLPWIIDDYGKANRSIFIYHHIENEFFNSYRFVFLLKKQSI